MNNTVKIKIKGKNIERFLKRLISFNIELLKIEYIKYNEIFVQIRKTNIDRVMELKTIYEIEVVEVYGIDKLKQIIKKYKYIIISIIISFLFILYLSNTIFSINIMHNDKNLRELLLNELRENDIKVYSLKKNYKYITKVKTKILEKYKDKIEWLEIENSGTKCIVRVEMRKINNIKSTDIKRNVVAKKDAIIMSITSTKGEILKYKNDYVKKGDVIISGNIYFNENIKDTVEANGKVYGEVWYKAVVEYPLKYREEKILDKEKNIYIFKLGNFNFKLNTIKNYNVVSKERTILKHLFLPISLIKQTNKKIEYIEQSLTKDEAVTKASEYAIMKMKSKLNDNEYIINTKNLKVEQNNSKIVIEMFFSVCEDITDYAIIEGE